MKNITIGVLAVQGSFAEHLNSVEKLGLKTIPVRYASEISQIAGLILPGGESTAISKLLKFNELRAAILKAVKKNLPIYGTCAGSILLAKKVLGKVIPDSFGLMDIEVARNAYGSQLDSFETDLEISLNNKKQTIPAVFIRAPIIKKVGDKVQVLARLNNSQIVLARQGNCLVSTFHPELTEDLTIHRYFVEMCGGI